MQKLNACLVGRIIPIVLKRMVKSELMLRTVIGGKMAHKLNATTAMFPKLDHLKAVHKIHNTELTDCFGWIETNHIQLCPQNLGSIDSSVTNDLLKFYPSTKFRLHADVRIDHQPRKNHDAIEYPYQVIEEKFAKTLRIKSGYDLLPECGWFHDLRIASAVWLNSDVAVLHAGNREHGDLAKLRDCVKYLNYHYSILDGQFAYRSVNKLFPNFRVAIEGLYPVKGNTLLISTWTEYQWLLESGLEYAIDLSHLNIVAKRSRKTERSLTEELISSPMCVEVHVSANDGYEDLHLPITDYDTWWLPLLGKIHPDAVLFCESNYQSKRRLTRT